MTKITEQEVGEVAQLARLNLSAEEVEKYQHELTDILGYVETINEVDTGSVEPTAQVTGLADVTRDDKKIPSEVTREEMLANAPEKKDGYIKVKAVLE